LGISFSFRRLGELLDYTIYVVGKKGFSFVVVEIIELIDVKWHGFAP
jgi:hypothetical protein